MMKKAPRLNLRQGAFLTNLCNRISVRLGQSMDSIKRMISIRYHRQRMFILSDLEDLLVLAQR